MNDDERPVLTFEVLILIGVISLMVFMLIWSAWA